jgi:hypothetical protein
VSDPKTQPVVGVKVVYRPIQAGEIEFIEVRLVGRRPSRIGSVRRLTQANWVAYAVPRAARFGNIRAGFADRRAAAAWLVIKAGVTPPDRNGSE